MKIIAVNAGSSSLKFQLLEMPSEEVIASGVTERIGLEDAVYTIKFNDDKVSKTLPILNHSVAVKLLLDSLIEHKIIKTLDEIEGVGHRVVQGGEVFKESAIINKLVIAAIDSLSGLAPLHNPPNLIGIREFVKVLPNVTQLAVFDTTFHQTMAEDAFLYATPYEWYEEYGVRKYGFHGTSHQYVSELATKMIGKEDAKVIVCHIGNGVSITAVDSYKSVDTSMGLTPLEGVPMGTRSGNIDPAIIGLIAEREGKSLEEILDILNKNSGYLGVSGVSNDSRDIAKAASEGNHRAFLAMQLQAKKIADYIGSYYVRLGGLDAIAFTAGIGENSSEIRKMIIDYVKVLGVELDEKLNNTKGVTGDISTKDSKVKVLVIPTDEEVVIAREVYKYL